MLLSLDQTTDLGICVAQNNNRNFWGSGSWSKKVSALINDLEYNIAYGKNLSKARAWLLASAICFMLYADN